MAPLLLVVNFTNILCAVFSYESFVCSFLYLHFSPALFCRKDIGAKAALKMLVKLTHTNNLGYANATAPMNNFE